jgi:hypothetical protein
MTIQTITFANNRRADEIAFAKYLDRCGYEGYVASIGSDHRGVSAIILGSKRVNLEQFTQTIPTDMGNTMVVLSANDFDNEVITKGLFQMNRCKNCKAPVALSNYCSNECASANCDGGEHYGGY